MDLNIEKQAAEVLLDRGIKVPVTAPLLFRLFGIGRVAHVVIRPPSQGTLQRIGQIALSAGITEDTLKALDETNAHHLYKRYGWYISKIVANAWLNGFFMGNPLFTVIAAWYFHWHMDNLKSLHAAKILDLLSSKTSFTNIIRLVSGLRMTAPNLSQKEKGS